jgi:hypothetical protein
VTTRVAWLGSTVLGLLGVTLAAVPVVTGWPRLAVLILGSLVLLSAALTYPMARGKARAGATVHPAKAAGGRTMLRQKGGKKSVNLQSAGDIRIGTETPRPDGS